MIKVTVKKEKVGIIAWLVAIFFGMMPFDLYHPHNIPVLSLMSIIIIFCIFVKSRYLCFSIIQPIKIFMAFMFFSGVTVLYSIDFSRSLSAFITLVMNMFLVFIIVVCTKFNDREIELIKKGLVIGGILCAITVLLFSSLLSGDREGLNIGGQGLDENMLNGYWVFPIAYFTNQFYKKKKSIYVIPVFLIIGLSLYTGSRGGAMALVLVIFSVIFYWCIVKKEYNNKITILLIMILILCVTFGEKWLSYIPDDILMRFSVEYIKENGTTGRTDIWKALFKTFEEAPFLRQIFGHGIGTTNLVSTAKVYTVSGGFSAHNLWMDQLIVGGIVGITIMTLMQIKTLNTAIRIKDQVMVASYFGLLIMCFSLSLVSYKPIWNCMLMIFIEYKNCKSRSIM